MSELNLNPHGAFLKTSGMKSNLKSTESHLKPASIEVWRFLLIILIVSVVAITLTILIELFMASFFEENPEIRWTVTTMPTF